MIGSGFGAGVGIHGLGMVLFWGLLILGGVWLVRGLSGRGPATNRGGRSAREILDARFARGEIDAEEYGRNRKQLTRDTRRTGADH
ncbi:SHOCT domain-containing protein [Marichromatium gracile]|uniref:SHOCT domain-containing protein n=1 Tax=Marichromatium gracile TaxID=1048 RepID=UPI001F347E8C|nr:SHOCT domain-containing protein [Marichromatium gracile]MCF1183277.1 SHOCT domain-containing protein [Marichromatium gracile]